MITGRVLVFGGTIEGRKVSDYLIECKIDHTLCVATEYGEEVLTPQEFLNIRQGRMTTQEMCAYMKECGFEAVVDATHPYAVEVSKNIRQACEKTGLPYLRFLRPQGSWQEDEKGQILVNSSVEAADYLETQEGQIFLTTGSKELHVFTERISDKSRLFARVLPSAQVMESCRALGLEGKQICGMQGPFSAEINIAMMRQANAKYMVTKNTGTSGGFPEKMEAAKALGLKTVVIRRPEEAGYNWKELTEKLQPYVKEKKQIEEETINASINMTVEESNTMNRQINCIGIGMGTLATMTHESAEVITHADILFGAKRILESVCTMFWSDRSGMPAIVTEYAGNRIAEYLNMHPEYKKIAILMSGDVGFYSGARGIEKAFPNDSVRYYCGISSVIYFASKIPTAWQDATLISAHGKQIALLNQVKKHKKIIMLVSGREDVERICRELHEAGMKDLKVTVGTNLSYPEETIRSGMPEDFLSCDTTGLHIMMVENPNAQFIITPGMPDDVFIRGKVPMTKEEIRILSVAKLRLTEDAVVYDVGAGTGSVSLEAARLCSDGMVYAIERNPEGISLIKENSRNLCLSNVVPVEGLAPDALVDLPAPTHAFIGGSAGNMKEIVSLLLEKNPCVRIVINTIALESIAEVINVLKELQIPDADIVQISAARSRELGRYHMMTAQNPIYIISFGG